MPRQECRTRVSAFDIVAVHSRKGIISAVTFDRIQRRVESTSLLVAEKPILFANRLSKRLPVAQNAHVWTSDATCELLYLYIIHVCNIVCTFFYKYTFNYYCLFLK